MYDAYTYLCDWLDKKQYHNQLYHILQTMRTRISNIMDVGVQSSRPTFMIEWNGKLQPMKMIKSGDPPPW